MAIRDVKNLHTSNHASALSPKNQRQHCSGFTLQVLILKTTMLVNYKPLNSATVRKIHHVLGSGHYREI